MPHRILLIDDSKAIHALVASRLSSEPATLMSAYSGQEGLAAARRFAPDLILLDVDLPDVSGLEICRQLKADESTADIPLIFLSSGISPDDRIYDPELGAADFITKPFNPAELRARIRAALRTRELLQRVQTDARIDTQSGLWNRAYFDQRFCQELSLARRTGRPLACILAEIDQLASMSATFGRTFEDELIQSVGIALSNATRLEDEVCRFGPDQFIVLCPATDRLGAESLLAHCRGFIAEIQLKPQGQPVPIACSFGVAEDDGQKMSIIERAERALQSVKAGRNPEPELALASNDLNFIADI